MELVGVGNALMDLISFVDEAFAPSIGIHNNAVVHLQRGKLDSIIPLIPDCMSTAGGGAANTCKAAAFLGIKAAFAGCVGIDDLGAEYAAELAACGVEPILSTSAGATGVYCALIRPDGGRTLIVSPGAALDLSLTAPAEGIFRRGATLYIEAFLLHSRQFFIDCIHRAKNRSMEVAVDLGSQAVTTANREFLLGCIQNRRGWPGCPDIDHSFLPGCFLNAFFG